jgi:hypothetical protein
MKSLSEVYLAKAAKLAAKAKSASKPAYKERFEEWRLRISVWRKNTGPNPGKRKRAVESVVENQKSESAAVTRAVDGDLPKKQ